MRKEKRKSATLCLVAAVFLSVFFAQTAEALRLTKTAKRGGRREVDDAAAAVQEGKIFFGAEYEKRSDLDSLVGGASSYNGDVNSFQADFAGWPKGFAPDSISKEATWKRMSPSLQCAGDQMRFKVTGPGASHLALAQGNSLPLPLTSIPSNCGYVLQKTSIGLVVLVPYDGCNVIQKGGNYALSLHWQGIPVLLLCPRPILHSKPAVPHPLPPAPPAQRHQIPPVYQLPQMPMPPVPVMPPVFQTRKFLSHQAIDPRPPLPPFIPPYLPTSQFSSIALPDPPLPPLAQYPSSYPHSLNYPAPPPIGATPLNTFATHLQPFPPLPQAHLPPGPHLDVEQSQLVTDPGVPKLPHNLPHTHFLPMFPRGFSQTRHLPDPNGAKPGLMPMPRMMHSPSDHRPGLMPMPRMMHSPSDHKPGLMPMPRMMHSPSDHKPGLMPMPRMMHFPSDPKHGLLPLPGMVPYPSDPNPVMPLPSDPWPEIIALPGDPWLGLIPLQANGNADSPPAQSLYPQHSHPFPPSLPKLPRKHVPHGLSHHQFDVFPPSLPKLPHKHVPHSQSHHQFDVFPPSNTKS